MYQRDFILRMIEMLGELVAGILSMIKKRDFPQAKEALENAYYEFLKQDASFFKGIKKSELTELLIKEHNYTNGHLEILAELLYAEAELAFAQGNYVESIEFYEKSLFLFLFIDNESKVFSLDKQNKIATIKNKLQELSKKAN